jgi:hypothetical protein
MLSCSHASRKESFAAQSLAVLLILTFALVLPVNSFSRHLHSNNIRQDKPANARTVSGVASSTEPTADSQSSKTEINEAYGKLPLSFEANAGQLDKRVQFTSRGAGYNLFLTSNEAVMSLRQTSTTKNPARPFSTNSILRMKLLGANEDARVAGDEQLNGTINYFNGNDPAKWRTNVPTFARVKYTEVYRGVDMVYYGNQRQLEYDFIVAPHANPNVIKLKFDGVRKLSVDANGNLILETPGGAIHQNKPVVYQIVNGVQREVAGNYVVRGKREVGFAVGDYDASLPLVIDPVLVYSTYFGGSSSGEAAYDIAVDADGNAYITGETNSSNFPTTAGAFQPIYHSDFGGGVAEAFITKFNPAGTALVYSTYLGGGNHDRAFGLAIDAEGNAYVAGKTFSNNFPTTANAYQPSYAGGFNGGASAGDAFISKLNPTGTALLYSTYLGGSNADGADDIAIDGAGNAYVTGGTISTNFPTLNAIRPTLGGDSDAFVAKLDTNASGAASLIYSTYLGGTGPRWFNSFNAGIDSGHAIAVDASGSAYVTGSTESGDFPTTANAFQKTIACDGDNFRSDAFVSKLTPAGNDFVYSTYLGGCATDNANAIALDANGNAFVTGSTTSLNFPTTPDSLQPNRSSTQDIFVTKLNATGSALVYSTYIGSTVAGGDGSSAGRGIAIDASGAAYVAATTDAVFMPQVNALLPSNLSEEAYILKLNPAGTDLIYTTYLGGDGNDFGNAIAIDSARDAYIAGSTTSRTFPTANPYQASRNGEGDAFLSKLHVGDNEPTYSISGTVTDANGNPYAGAEVNLFGAAHLRRITDANGFYSFNRLRAGGNYELRVFKPCITFNASIQNVNNLTANQTVNFSGSPTLFTISGRITEASGTYGLSGVTVNLTGGQTRSTQTNVNGYYSFTFPGCYTYTITPVKPNTTFTPASRTYDGTMSNSFANFKGPALPPTTPNPGDLLITEFRFRGTGAGASQYASVDEFVELYNNTDSFINVSTTDGSGGWTLVTSDGTTRMTIPNGTVIPARAHLLGAGTGGNYNLADQQLGPDIPDGAGLALFRTSNAANYTAANRIDAVGFVSTTNALYRQGSGLTPGTGILENAEFSFVRKFVAASGLPQNTNDNAADFELISTTGATLSGRASVLGMPAPEALRSPMQRNDIFATSLIDPTTSRQGTPNLARVGSGNSGTLSFRRQFTNNTGATITQLQFRVIDITTLNSPVASGPQADLRLTTSGDTTAVTGLGTVTVKGTSLYALPSQPLGGGLNSPVLVTLPDNGLAPGESINVQFLMNVIQNGKYRFYINVEAL